eukprot:1436187-Alexandrium_andersonii.AAC.1
MGARWRCTFAEILHAHAEKHQGATRLATCANGLTQSAPHRSRVFHSRSSQRQLPQRSLR